MESLDHKFLEKINKTLGEIIRAVSCTTCNYLMKNPVAMFCPCNHRCCERCITSQFPHKPDYHQRDECEICYGRYWFCDRKPQASLNTYIFHFKKFVSMLDKGKSPIAAELHDFVDRKIGISDFEHLYKCSNEILDFDPDEVLESEDESNKIQIDNKAPNDSVISPDSDEKLANENENKDCNKTTAEPNMTFLPELCSTSVKSRNPRNNFFAANNSAILFDTSNRLVNETVVNFNKANDVCSDEKNDIQKKPKLTTLIESFASTSQDYNDSTVIDSQDDEEELQSIEVPADMIESQEVPMFENYDQENLQDSYCSHIDGTSVEFNQSDNAESNPTQSQYHVIRPSITYSSKITDRFDRVVHQSKTLPQAPTTKITDPNSSCQQESILKDNNRSNISGISAMSRSQSPELLMSSDFYSDEDLMNTPF